MWRLKPWTLKRAQVETIFDADTNKHCPEAQLKMCTVLGAPSVWKTVEFVPLYIYDHEKPKLNMRVTPYC